MSGDSSNVPASIRAKLLNLSRTRGDEFQYVLTRFAQERLLYRLAQSSYCDSFTLKGALLFVVWEELEHRPTRDVDLLGRGQPDAARIERVFRELCEVDLSGMDGLTFEPDSVTSEVIREDAKYDGLRMRLRASLDGARLPLQVDIGFGDAVQPGAELVRYPTLIELPEPVIRAYPREVVIAEKVQAAVELGVINSRVKDFFDTHHLLQHYVFDGLRVSRALAATFERRGTAIPAEEPVFLTEEFFARSDKQRQWEAFKIRNGLGAVPALPEVQARSGPS